jgi:dienelactone hydrolase
LPVAPKPRGPLGDLATFTRERFEADGFSHDVYRKGVGPAVIVITEMPGISPRVLGFADRVVGIGCTAVLPDLFGTAGRDPLADGPIRAVLYGLGSIGAACISREFTLFAMGQSSPVVRWLRSLAAREHERCEGPGVGVVGMCFTGGFALAMAVDPRVLAPVLSQPSLPFALSNAHRGSVDCDPDTLDAVARRCDREGLKVLGLRFRGDPFSPGRRFEFLRQRLGSGFVAVELDQSSRHPDGFLPRAHSVLTEDLVDAPGEPTRAALDQVLELFSSRLRGC